MFFKNLHLSGTLIGENMPFEKNHLNFHPFKSHDLGQYNLWLPSKNKICFLSVTLFIVYRFQIRINMYYVLACKSTNTTWIDLISIPQLPQDIFYKLFKQG